MLGTPVQSDSPIERSSPSAGEGERDWFAECSCPIGIDCKHAFAVATVISGGSGAVRTAHAPMCGFGIQSVLCSRCVKAVLDSSFLISLARAGLLDLLEKVPFELVLLTEVRAEAVTSGMAAGHVDAAAIQAATEALPVRATSRRGRRPVDSVVVEAASQAGLLVANDLALGRRARNRGAEWLRSVDIVILLADLGRIDLAAARAAVVALRDANRITSEMADTYLDRLATEGS